MSILLSVHVEEQEDGAPPRIFFSSSMDPLVTQARVDHALDMMGIVLRMPTHTYPQPSVLVHMEIIRDQRGLFILSIARGGCTVYDDQNGCVDIPTIISLTSTIRREIYMNHGWQL